MGRGEARAWLTAGAMTVEHVFGRAIIPITPFLASQRGWRG